MNFTSFRAVQKQSDPLWVWLMKKQIDNENNVSSYVDVTLEEYILFIKHLSSWLVDDKHASVQQPHLKSFFIRRLVQIVNTRSNTFTYILRIT